MKLVSIETIPGQEFEALDIVRGTVVYSKNFGRDFMAGMKTLVGGEITGYTEMLVEAQNEEELAAIWIAATARELSERRSGNGLRRYANMLYIAACDFLQPRYYLWHHAMRRLVPEILIPSSVLESMVCKDPEPVIGVIQMNTVLLKSTWRILRYSSLEEGERPESHQSSRKSGPAAAESGGTV